jgi:hypothetical protein
MKARYRHRLGLLGLGLTILLVTQGSLSFSTHAGSYNPCQKPGNVTQNCGFDEFVDHWVQNKRYQIPTGWWYYVLAGDPELRPADDTYWKAPSLCVLSDGLPFTAGIYQQVPVTPGVVYQTDIGWAAASCNDAICSNMERKLGLDPTGKTDPLAPSVIWSRIEAGGDKWPDLTVSARATGPTMTVFVWVHHPASYGLDRIFLDAVGLWPDPSQPAATVTPKPSLTPTRKPQPKKAAPIAATNTPTAPPPSATPTELPTSTPTSTPTETPTPTATPAWTPTPTPAPLTQSPFPTRTPLPTIVPVAMILSTAEPMTAMQFAQKSPGGDSSGSVFLYVALGALAAGAILAGVLGWLWLRARKAAGKG